MGDADLFKSRVEFEIVKAQMEARKRDENARMEAANLRLAIYHDDWVQDLEDKLKEQFLAENWRKIRLTRNVSQNITKKVVNEISMVYKRAAQRHLMIGEKALEDPTPYGELDLDTIMDLANKYMNLLNDCGILVDWDYRRNHVRLSLLTPANTVIFTDLNDPEQCSGFAYKLENADDSTRPDAVRWVYWDDEQHFVFDDRYNRFDPTADGSNPEMVNPYGRMPVVWLHKSKRPGMFWNPSEGFDLVDGTLGTGIKRTLKDYSFKMQSFKQVWFTNIDDSIGGEMAMDPAKAWKLPPDAQAGVLDLTTDFATLDNTIASDIDGLLSAYGLSAAMFSSTESESGVALEIKNRGLRELREKQIAIFRAAESELFDIIRLVNNTRNAEEVPSDAVFSIDFAEPDVYVDPEQIRKQALFDLNHGLISPAEFYMRFNPDVGPDAAQAKIEENLKGLAVLKDLGFTMDSSVNEVVSDRSKSEEFAE